MGAHTLGEAEKENTGYDGEWTPGEENVFDNKYYKNMMQSSGIVWTAVVSSSVKIQSKYV